jgi:secreted PhoX family phosphatase
MTTLGSVRSRRRFLKKAALGVGVGLPLAALARRVDAAGYGPLIADPDGIFDLPEGFSYRVLQRRGDPMSDGYLAPGKMDGMACFMGERDSYVVLRNQELSASHAQVERGLGEGDPFPACTYDPAEPGGVVRLVLDRETLEIRDSRIVLYGTFMNCAGGESPWGWLSCEEMDDRYEADASLGHGYVFLVKPTDHGSNEPRPIEGYGRFRHEAAVVLAATQTCYLTEDRPDGCFYRFVPESKRTPFEGTLQALKVKGSDRFDLSSGLGQGDVLDVEWVDIDDPDAKGQTTRAQAQSLGAAIVARGEGIAAHADDVYICATTGGPQALGQIFRYRERPGADPYDPSVDGTLELVLQNEEEARLAQPDNIVVAPWGDVFMCEDAYNGRQHLRVLTRQGEVYDMGHNALSSLELAGVCFSPDGRALFVNLQHDGIMLAITGPFPEVRIPSREVPVGLAGSACRVRPKGRARAGVWSTAALAAASALRRWR